MPDREWAIHVCEGHGLQGCVLCGVFDVVPVVPASERDRLQGLLDEAKEALEAAREDCIDIAQAGFDSTRMEGAEAAVARIGRALVALEGGVA